MKLKKLLKTILIVLIPLILASLTINLVSCQTFEPEKEARENTFMILYNKTLSQALCGEYKYLGEEKYSFLKWHPLERCNGMFCAGNLKDLPNSVLKPTPTPRPTPKPTPIWNDNGEGGQGWNDK